jgi:hypothetical protein
MSAFRAWLGSKHRFISQPCRYTNSCNKLNCPIETSRNLDLVYGYNLGWNVTYLKTRNKEAEISKIAKIFILLVCLFLVP